MTLLGPLFWYELRRLPRRRQMHFWRVLYAGALLIGLVVVYLWMFRDVPPLEALANPGRLDRAGTAEFANSFLMAFLAVQQVAVIVLTPIYAAGSIADEKERRTLDFLLSSPLSRFEIVFGKVCSRLVFIGGILAAGLPVLMLTMLFGGVDLEHLLAGFAVSTITAIFLANLGVLLACVKPNLRATLPGMAMALLVPAVFGLCGFCSPRFAAASPITVLGILFRAWLKNDPAGDLTWELVAFTGAVHTVVSAMLFAEALRSIGRETDTGHTLTESTPEQVRQRAADRAHWLGSNDPETARVSFALGRTYGVPRLGDAEDPLIWKERWFRTPWHSVHRGFASAAGLVTALASLAGFTFVAMLILFVKAARELAATQSLVETTNTLQLSVFPAAVVLWPALLGVRASASLGRERAAQTLTALFTVPVERSAVLRAIAAAIFIRDRRTMAFFAGVSVVGMIAGGVDSACAVAALILLTGCAAWAVAFGIWLSVQIETPARASLIFLGAWGGLLLLPWMVAPFGGSEIADRVELLCPPYALSELFVASREVTEATGTAAEMALATGLGMLALAAGFAWHAVRTFEREGK